MKKDEVASLTKKSNGEATQTSTMRGPSKCIMGYPIIQVNTCSKKNQDMMVPVANIC